MKGALSVLLLCFLLASCGEEKAVETGEAVESEEATQERAELGDVEAQNSLGWMYYKGEEVPKDDVEAAKWFRKAAEQGVAIAQRNGAMLYANGKGVPKDMTEATKWIRKAAEQGNADAKEWLKKNAKDKSE